ncbi:hypothetical protein ACL02T_08290 [Pseudonocardia sp. RS010]|uniref:hypothetical protein n=1 Tax=Pseudonocardia sp. RS010 TaxID=3385979 RepID=UPI0039A03A0D
MPGPCDPWLTAVAARGRFGGAPALPLPDVRRCVVASAHRHEDLCAAGGLMAALAEKGATVEVLVVTDGDGGPERPGAHARDGPRSPDGRRARSSVERAHADLLRDDRDGTLLVAPWERDGHPDHDLVGAVADRIARQHDVPLLRYALEAWRDDGTRSGIGRLPRHAVRRLDLPGTVLERKNRAVVGLAAGRADADPGCAAAELFLV